MIFICLSRNAVKKRGFIQAEMRMAVEAARERPEEDIYIVPLRLEADLKDDEIPAQLTAYQYIDIFEERAIEKVVASIAYQRRRSARET